MLRLACVVALVGLAVARAPSATADPFAFFQPTIAFTADDLQRLDEDGTLARTLPSGRDSLAVFAAVAVDIGGDRLEAWIQNIAAFKQGPQVLAIGRFSDPPVQEDLAGLTFPDGDLDDVKKCAIGHCGLKLTRAEIIELSRLPARDASPAVLHDALRRIVLQRVQTYLTGGLTALAAYENGSSITPTATAFSRLMGESLFLAERLPQFSALVEQWPHIEGIAAEPVQSFVYWSVENYGGKPIVSATHVFVRRGNGNGRGAPETLVIGKQLFATHYADAWLGLTALVRNPQNGRAYLVYFHRSSVDILRGFWGGLISHILKRRLQAEAPTVLNGIRRRLESGMPPVRAVTTSVRDQGPSTLRSR